jgi:hypothetical protein
VIRIRHLSASPSLLDMIQFFLCNAQAESSLAWLFLLPSLCDFIPLLMRPVPASEAGRLAHYFCTTPESMPPVTQRRQQGDHASTEYHNQLPDDSLLSSKYCCPESRRTEDNQQNLYGIELKMYPGATLLRRSGRALSRPARWYDVQSSISPVSYAPWMYSQGLQELKLRSP